MDRGAIDFRLLGPVEAAAGGETLQLGGPRQRALLALLALDPGRPVAAERLADELWQGRPPPGAQTTLRSYVSRLRRVLGPAAVVAHPGGYALDAPAQQVDAVRFEQLARDGANALARGAAGLAAERLHAALALWRGPALADVRDAGALARESMRLEELRLACMEDRVDADLALGRHAELVPELRALVDAEPLRERLRRQLVLALYRSGRQADALEAYRDARETLDRELGLEPGAELRELERAILRHEVDGVDAPAAQHNLPVAGTSFVGRDTELAELARLLREHRIVTVTGVGGCGKTRVATELARRQVGAWRDGVRLVDLAALADPALVRAAVAAAVELHEDALLDELRRRELLLVLDNCEHVVAACADLASAIVSTCPDVRVLATSRVPLAVGAEADYALAPLESSSAVRLFLERARTVRRDLPDDEQTHATVEEICAELDGLPLAIELAAARAKALSPGEIAARLDDRLRFLRAWRRVADPRHRTLETTMDWSYELLGAEEQQLLRRLAVFAGGATLDAVAAVCLGGDDDKAVDLLSRVVDASLVAAPAGEPTRYRLLETVRQYAAAKLADDPAADDVRRAHAGHYLAVAQSANLSFDALGRGTQRQEIALAEQHNLRAALDWAAEADIETALRLALALENFWVTQALEEGARRLADLTARAGGADPLLRAAAFRDLGACLDVLGRLDEARRAYEQSRAFFVEAGDEVGIANLDFRLGVIASLAGDKATARELWEGCLETFTRHDDVVGQIQALGNLGGLELDSGGDYERGRQMIDRGLELARAVGWRWWAARMSGSLAERLVVRGELDEGEQFARGYLEFASTTANRQEQLLALAILARAAASRGDEQRALALWASVQAVDDGPGRFGSFDRDEYDAAMPQAPRPEPLPLEQAVALALG